MSLRTTSWFFVYLLAPFCAVAQSQTFTIDWFSIDGGGGTSSGGNYTVTGTIGQADAGVMSGGNFTLAGGFWGAAMQTPGAPTLRIDQQPNGMVRISWPPESSGFVLEAADSLQAVQWSVLPTGASNQVTVPSAPFKRFYRLRRQ